MRRSSGGCCASTAIEIGGGLGPDAPPIWRVGLMGHNATLPTAERLLEAFDATLAPRPTYSQIA